MLQALPCTDRLCWWLCRCQVACSLLLVAGHQRIKVSCIVRHLIPVMWVGAVFLGKLIIDVSLTHSVDDEVACALRFIITLTAPEQQTQQTMHQMFVQYHGHNCDAASLHKSRTKQ